MKHLKAINKYFIRYRWRLILGIIFIVLSNYFRILAPQLTGYVVDAVQVEVLQEKNPEKVPAKQAEMDRKEQRFDVMVRSLTHYLQSQHISFSKKVLVCGITLLILALLGGFFMFLMRQTIIVMSRLIEYDQKNEVFRHYMRLDSNFFKTNSTGDLMNRMAEDVSRVRMYTGPALMYFINLAATLGFSLYFMFSTQPALTLYVLAPLPILAGTIYYINTIIHRKSEKIQRLLSDLTTNAQESYSGIRVIKSFAQEKAMFGFFQKNSEAYREQTIGLARMEAFYFPTMALLIGLSTLLTIMIGGIYSIRGEHEVTLGTITEFVMYVNMLTFPVSAIGWTASMTQRAAASQKRLNEFLDVEPVIQNPLSPAGNQLQGEILFDHVDFTYPNTGIRALADFNLHIKPGQKIAIIGHTGSGKTTVAQLLLRMYDPDNGRVCIDGISVRDMQLQEMRRQICYVPQDVFLFSDTVANNISFGMPEASRERVLRAASLASVDKEIEQFGSGYETMIGERGVTLSGGQKQRISIARALIRDPEIIVFDDCLSAVDARTEKQILGNLNSFLKNKTAIIITHRIFTLLEFDNIVVLEEGKIVEMGRHDELLAKNGYYTFLYEQQRQEREQGAES